MCVPGKGKGAEHAMWASIFYIVIEFLLGGRRTEDCDVRPSRVFSLSAPLVSVFVTISPRRIQM